MTADMLADEAVTEAKVASGAITADKIVGGAGSGVDADLLDGQSAENFLGVTGGTVDGLITIEGTSGPQLVIHDSGLIAERPRIQFTGNYIHFVAGDDLSDEHFGFYSAYGSERNYDAKLRVHGKAADSWGHFIGLTHNGTDGIVETDSGDLLLSPAGDVRLSAAKGVVYPDGSRQTTAYTASLEARVASLESEVAFLKTLLGNVTRSGNDIHFNGVNVHVNNGTGYTDDTENGLGNLIIGYNEERNGGNNVRSGSHNLIVGRWNNYSSYGGIVAGDLNTISGFFSTVIGGYGNVASGDNSCVTGGYFNTASGNYSSLSGGTERSVENEYDWRGGEYFSDQ